MLFLEVDLYVFEILIWPVVAVHKLCQFFRGKGRVSLKMMEDDSGEGGGLK